MKQQHDIHYARLLAAHAKCDPRTVMSYLQGGNVHDSTRHAIREAIRIVNGDSKTWLTVKEVLTND